MMYVVFYDRQVEANPLNGAVIKDEAGLRRIISELRRRPAFFCELVGENGRNLLVGISQELGCVQFSHADGSTPYLMATNDEAKRRNEHMEFLTGGTLTPVPARFC